MSETFEGGCHCGAIRYRFAGPPICVNGCHCRDCQTLSGSAFAVNAMIESDRVDLLRGEPETDPQFGTRCPTCKVLLWATHPMFGEAIRFVRTGTLDEAERLSPSLHVFVRSKHPWIVLPDDVPAYDTLPGESDSLFDAGQQARLAAATRAPLAGSGAGG
jgi:hypothetical protein